MSFIYLKLISIFNIVAFEHRNENREDWLNIDTIRIPCRIIYIVNSKYYKNPTEFFSNSELIGPKVVISKSLYGFLDQPKVVS